MTNREKLKEVFPYTIFIYRKENDKTNAIMCTDEWLDSEYIEPTTKNNLGVDCISREQALVAIRNLYPSMPRVDFNGSLRKWVDKYKPYIECDDAIKELPSVTPQEPNIKALGEELRKARKGIAEEKVLIGSNMAIAICNQHLEGSEAADDQSGAG